MTKIVLQISEDDENWERFLNLRVIGDAGPHGPHTISSLQTDAETGKPVMHVRIKRKTTAEAVAALSQLLQL